LDYSGSTALKSGAKTHPGSCDEDSISSPASIAALHRLSAPDNPLDLKMNQTPDSASRARLWLKFAENSGTTRMVERDHHGPLVVQKPLYPEGHGVCQAVVMHPPGGVVAGDELEIRVHAVRLLMARSPLLARQNGTSPPVVLRARTFICMWKRAARWSGCRRKRFFSIVQKSCSIIRSCWRRIQFT